MPNESEFNLPEDFSDKLRSVTNKDVEAAIAKAISELTKVKTSCTITQISYDGRGAKLNLELSEPLDIDALRQTGFIR